MRFRIHLWFSAGYHFAVGVWVGVCVCFWTNRWHQTNFGVIVATSYSYSLCQNNAIIRNNHNRCLWQNHQHECTLSPVVQCKSITMKWKKMRYKNMEARWMYVMWKDRQYRTFSIYSHDIRVHWQTLKFVHVYRFRSSIAPWYSCFNFCTPDFDE